MVITSREIVRDYLTDEGKTYWQIWHREINGVSYAFSSITTSRAKRLTVIKHLGAPLGPGGAWGLMVHHFETVA